jgi:hypothetical protein
MRMHIESHCMAVERVDFVRRPTMFGSQLAFDIHMLTTDVSAALDLAGEIGVAE